MGALAAWAAAAAASPTGKMIVAAALRFAIGAAIVWGAYALGRHDGRAALAARLAGERVTILKDGKEIDEKLLAGGDDYLCDVLGGC